MTAARTILLLCAANVFITLAWYRHLRAQANAPLWSAILVSWGIAFLGYCLAVPANRYGFGRFSVVQLKVTQEIISLVAFGIFASVSMKERLSSNHMISALCLVAAAYFAFRK